MADNTGRGHTATIKFGDKYDAPWLVLTSDTSAGLREELVAAVGLEVSPEATLDDVLVQAVVSAQATYQAAKGLGARPLAGRQSGAANAAASSAFAAARGDAAPAAKPAAPPAEQEDPLVAALGRVTSKAEIGKLFAANREAWKRPEVGAAAKAAAERVG